MHVSSRSEFLHEAIKFDTGYVACIGNQLAMHLIELL